jgi:hypothetical protein
MRFVAAAQMNQFTADYCTAIDNYMDGDWGAAKSQLEACADQEPGAHLHGSCLSRRTLI